MIRVAVDSGPQTSGNTIRGIGVHTRELVNHLKNFKDISVDLVDFTKTDLTNYDISHYPFFRPYFLTLPFFKPCKKIVLTIHDLIPLIYPDEYPAGVRGDIKFIIQKHNLRNVDAVITISETSKKDIVRFLGFPPDKIYVTYLASQSQNRNYTPKIKSEIKKKYNLPDKFILYVGDVNYNKNLLTLALACKKADISLVIVGKQAAEDNFDNANWENHTWVEFLQKYGQDSKIKRVGYLESGELPYFYKLATAYCQPSFYEGFGLPVLEAFANKCPVIASKIQVHMEIAENSVYFFDPKNIDELVNAINKVVSSQKLREDLIKKGSQRVKNFSWQETAKKTLIAYKSVL